MEFELNNGIVITVEWDTINEPDPEVGIFVPYVNGWWITHFDGEKCDRVASDIVMTQISANEVENIERKIIEEYY